MAEQCCPFGIGPKLAVVQVVQVVSKKAKEYHVCHSPAKWKLLPSFQLDEVATMINR